MNQTPLESPGAAPRKEAESLRELSPQQWKSGIAAWLGWFFDGLDMHLYTLVAAPFVMYLVQASAVTDLDVKEKSSWIQAAFLVGWALGGGFFGYIGDRIGRARALSLTILTYAVFTGLSFFAETWWHLMIFRFVAALGIGGEWAVGSTLLSETWPKKWRPWIAAVLQAGVNIGVLFACLSVYLMADLHPRYVFLVGIAPALIVFWIRRNVPEPDEWQAAKKKSTVTPGVAALFAADIRRTTLVIIGVCATSLTAWWAFMFWQAQHLRNLPALRAEMMNNGAEVEKIVARTFALTIGVSIVGNFFCGWLAQRLGYRRAIAIMCAAFFVTIQCTFQWDHDWRTLSTYWFPAVGFCSGMFGLFTMCLPPLFPVLLRTTGAGFCYNIGRIAAAAGTVLFGLFAKVGDFKTALLYASLLFIPATVFAMFIPEPEDHAP
ncbi:MAG: MFS transporter [Pedosphaera sp.]|nr:MFS transporter [Pedosphaera sp.]MSU42994.1 MFS transporter [Pedosphaera sp.]